MATAVAGEWQAVRTAAAAAAARQHQQARGFARFLQFQPRPGGGWGGGGGWLSDSDAVVKGLIGLNIAGFLLWRVAPGGVSMLRAWARSLRAETACTPSAWHAQYGSRLFPVCRCGPPSKQCVVDATPAACVTPAPPQMHTHATVSIEGLRAGRVWTVLTAAFSHQDIWHLGGNMLGLYFFGRDVGRLFGGKRVGGRGCGCGRGGACLRRMDGQA